MNGESDDNFEIIGNPSLDGDEFLESIDQEEPDKSGEETNKNEQRRPSKKSVWGAFKSSLSNITNNIKYNYFLPPHELKLKDHEWIRVFDSLYSVQGDNGDLLFDMSYIIWMSYRNGFNSILNEGKKFKSDCGWGCMIRCAQMMLARAIFLMKNNDFGIINKLEKNQKKEFDRKKIFDILILFFDNHLSYSELNEYKNSFCILSKKIVRDFELIDKPNSPKEICYLTPAFSIQNICKKGIKYGKGAGKWFSDVNMASIIAEINREINPLKGLQIMHFQEGVLYESEIIRSCFEEKICNCEIEYKKQQNPELFFCGNCLQNAILFQNKIFTFTHPGIIFVSVRLGLEAVEPRYINSILLLFNVPNNIGIIGGKPNKALYFIGRTDDNRLIYLDPHYNQKSAPNIEELRKTVNTYMPDKLYRIDIEDISPAFTIGFFFRNLEEYMVLMGAITDFTKGDRIFSVQEKPKNYTFKPAEKKGSTNIEDGDFLLLNY